MRRRNRRHHQLWLWKLPATTRTAATPGASNSLMKNHQWGFAPRIGVAWAPFTKLTVRAGYGMYFDRGELFSYLSPSAGSGFNGPFGVTLAPPFVQPISAASEREPFGAVWHGSAAATAGQPQLLFSPHCPTFKQTACGFPGCWPTGNLFGPFLFGGYDIHNKLPYTQNWTLDFQYELANNWCLNVGYVGNHGTHDVLPIPFNQPEIATPTSPVNGQIYFLRWDESRCILIMSPSSRTSFPATRQSAFPFRVRHEFGALRSRGYFQLQRSPGSGA